MSIECSGFLQKKLACIKMIQKIFLLLFLFASFFVIMGTSITKRALRKKSEYFREGFF